MSSRITTAASRAGRARRTIRRATPPPCRLIRHSIDRGVPLFAICRGLQEVNVALGGTLHQLVHEVDGRRDHRSPKSPDTDVNYAPAHDIEIVEGGLLHRLLGERRVQVNSLHAQGVDRLAPRARLEAVAEDGQVEAFSVPDAPAFALALQWHPEHRALENPVSMKLFDAFAAGLPLARRRAARAAPARGRGVAAMATHARPPATTRAATSTSASAASRWRRSGSRCTSSCRRSLRPSTRPPHWDYDKVRPFLMESGSLITAKEAVRRVLILENPAMPGSACITPSLYAGLQLILPGEVAPSHRHTQSALRFIVEGEGAYTAVDGERTIMREGDFVITPTWTWHDHGNDSKKPMVWLDGLDIPLVAMFNAGFAENGESDEQVVTAPEGTSDAKYASGLLPVDWKPARQTSPIFNYPYARTREALAGLAKAGPPDPCHGYKLRYVNPASGGAPIATMGTFMQLLPKGFATAPYRSTDGTVFSVVEGTGESVIGDKTFRWKKRDHFVVPSWAKVEHRAEGDAVLFSFSDRPVQEKLDLWREDRGGK